MSDVLEQEIERLRAHNAELLADLKTAKREAKDLAGQLEAVTAERDAARADYQGIALDAPVKQMAERLAVLPDHFLAEFGKRYTFARDESGIVVRDLEGNPATIKDDKGKPRPALFTEADIRTLCSESDAVQVFNHLLIGSMASGGGAIGSRWSPPTRDDKKPAEQPPAPAFGFR